MSKTRRCSIIGPLFMACALFFVVAYRTEAAPGGCATATTLCAETITPSQGSTSGGTAVSITGANFKTMYQPATSLVFPGGGNGQYIDTGVTQLGNNKKVEFQFQLDAAAVSSTSTNRIFGAFGTGWDNNSYALSKLSSSEPSNYGNNQFAVRVGGDPGQNESNANGTKFLGQKDANIHTWMQDNKAVYWGSPTLPSSPTTTLSDSNLSTSNGNTMYVGNIHYNGGLASSGIGGLPFSGAVYYLKMWDGGTLVRDYIPVKRNLDGVCGLWDRQNSVFYPNLGTGTLTCTADTSASPIIPASTTTVSFDGLPATNVAVSSDGKTITANTPAHAIGTVNVVVTVDGTSTTLANSYTYSVIITPNYGPDSGGTAVTLSGSFFEDYRLAGYEPAQYLTFNGTQYINTGVNQLPTTKVQLDFQQTATTNNYMFIFGVSNAVWNSSNYSLMKLSNTDGGQSTVYNKYAARYGSTNTSETPNTSISFYPQTQDTNPHTWIQDGATTYWDGANLGTKSASAPSVGMNMYLGTLNYNSSTGAPISTANWGANVNVYGLKIWQNGALMRDYIPVRNKTSGAYGLWDKVNHNFQPAAAGTLAGGTPVSPSYTVDFGGSPCNVTSITATTIACTTTAHAAGLVNATITGGDNAGTVTLPNAYTYTELYLSMASNKVAFTVSPGGQNSGSLDVQVATNNPTGYTLSLAMAPDGPDTGSGPTCTANKALTHTDTTNTIPASTNPWVTNGIPNTTLTTNTWGYSLTNPTTNNNYFMGIAPCSTPQTIKTTTTPNEAGGNTTVYYGAKIDISKKAGTYTGTVVYRGVVRL